MSDSGGVKYKNPVCRGSYMLGTACGSCERCKEHYPAWVEQSEKPKRDTGYKKLQRERDEYFAKWGEYMKRANLAEAEVQKLLSENQELQKRIDVLERAKKIWERRNGDASDLNDASQEAQHYNWLDEQNEKLEKENQGLREQITTLKSDLLRAEFFKREMEDSNFYLRQTINKKDAEIEKLKTELTFTKEYLNPADTSFRKMIDAFRVLPREKQDKLIELSKALVGLQSGGGEKSCQK